MAKFWSEHKNLVTGDDKNMIAFRDGVYITDDDAKIKILREKAKIKALHIVEVTPNEAEAPEKAKSKAIEPGKSKK